MHQLVETIDRLIENYDALAKIKDHPLYERETLLLKRTIESLHRRLTYLETHGTPPQDEPEYHYYINLGACLEASEDRL